MNINGQLRPRTPAAAPYAGDWTTERPRRRSLEALQLTLSKITEVLATELGRPGTNAPDWSETDWAVARAVAAIHGISPLLAASLRWHGPEPWTRFLIEQSTHTTQRYLRIQRLLRLIEDRARERAISLLPLKGAALHALGVYAAGERPMADIDLLVREEQLPVCRELLASVGFNETHQTWKHRVFARRDDGEPAALGEHAANGIKIEVHCRVAEALARHIVDISASVFPESPRPGFNAYPSRAALLLHLLLHTAGAMVTREARLLQLHDIARLTTILEPADWEELSLQASCTGDRSLWWAFPPLALANRYYGCVPEQVLRHVAADCHWALKGVYSRRTVAQASLSHLWISALPGIEWTRSLREMVAYATGRVLPNRETLRLRRALATVQPRVSGGTWSQLSQGERMVRWILSRPARYQTLQPVRAALRGAHG